jgi:hypothetical protein
MLITELQKKVHYGLLDFFYISNPLCMVNKWLMLLAYKISRKRMYTANIFVSPLFLACDKWQMRHNLLCKYVALLMLYEMVLPKKDNGDCFKELLDLAILISPHTDLNGKSKLTSEENLFNNLTILTI